MINVVVFMAPWFLIVDEYATAAVCVAQAELSALEDFALAHDSALGCRPGGAMPESAPARPEGD